MCRANRPESETEKFIEKITVPEDRFDLFVELKSWRKAAEVAQKLRDPYRLQEVSLVYVLFRYAANIVTRY